VLVIFPFEEALYRDAGVPVEWVGHPLLDLQPEVQPRDAFLREHGLDPERPVLALLPGSRTNELREILPGLAESAGLIRDRVAGVQFLLARAPHLGDELFDPLHRLQAAGVPLSVIAGRADDVLAAADAAVVASGTVTVQAALHECPMVVVYRLSPLTYRVGKPFVKVDTYAMVNLVAERRVVPELIQEDFTAEAVANEAVRLLTNRTDAEGMRADLRDVRRRLGSPGASRRAAEAIVQVAAARAGT